MITMEQIKGAWAAEEKRDEEARTMLADVAKNLKRLENEKKMYEEQKARMMRALDGAEKRITHLRILTVLTLLNDCLKAFPEYKTDWAKLDYGDSLGKRKSLRNGMDLLLTRYDDMNACLRSMNAMNLKNRDRYNLRLLYSSHSLDVDSDVIYDDNVYRDVVRHMEDALKNRPLKPSDIPEERKDEIIAALLKERPETAEMLTEKERKAYLNGAYGAPETENP